MRKQFASFIFFVGAALAPTLSAQTSPSPQPAPILAPDKVLASNPRASVTYADFEAELARIPPRDHFEFLLDRQRIAQMVDNMLLNKTLAIEARENKLDANPKVQAEILNQTDKVLAKYRGQQVQANAPKIDNLTRAREIYLANSERFNPPPAHEVWHILVSLKGRTAEQARERIDAARARLVAGESEEKVAISMSDDPTSRENKGNLGYVELKNLDERFAAAIRKLKVGEFSPVFESAYGLHVAKLRAYVVPAKITFEAVKDELAVEAESQYLMSVWDNHLRKLRNDPKLFVDTDALDTLRPRLPPIPAPDQVKVDTKK